MNWYKQLKISQHYLNPEKYTDIGHFFWEGRQAPVGVKEIIWLIDENWKLHTSEHDPSKSWETHIDLFTRKHGDGIAKGRAVLAPNKRVSSLILVDFSIQGKRREHLQNKAGNIISKHLNLDTVHTYDDYSNY